MLSFVGQHLSKAVMFFYAFALGEHFCGVCRALLKLAHLAQQCATHLIEAWLSSVH